VNAPSLPLPDFPSAVSAAKNVGVPLTITLVVLWQLVPRVDYGIAIANRVYAAVQYNTEVLNSVEDVCLLQRIPQRSP
jgi:hypothetical protein